MKKRIVTTTGVFEPGYPVDKAIDRLSALGFDAIDLAIDYCVQQPDWPFMTEQYLQWAADLKKQAEDAGTAFTHAHAPGDAAHTEHFARSLEVTAALGAKYLVLHPVWRDENDRIIEDESEFIRRNADAIRPWLPKAEALCVTILTENLLWGASIDPRIIAKLVQAVDSPYFGWCFDSGHANCFGIQPTVLLDCAVPPVSLHLQDNHGDPRDEHLIPGDGTIDWEALIRSLRAVGYAGDCVLEAHHQSLEAPDEQREPILARLLEKGRELREKMDA